MVADNLFIQRWAYASPEEQQDKFVFYSCTILALAVATSLFVFFRIMLLVCATLRASKTLHNRLIEKVMMAPINLFFDVTPIGKILNRFSRNGERVSRIAGSWHTTCFDFVKR